MKTAGTGREVEVVRLLAEGVESNAEIAERLGIELGTAKVHMGTWRTSTARPAGQQS